MSVSCHSDLSASLWSMCIYHWPSISIFHPFVRVASIERDLQLSRSPAWPKREGMSLMESPESEASTDEMGRGSVEEQSRVRHREAPPITHKQTNTADGSDSKRRKQSKHNIVNYGLLLFSSFLLRRLHLFLLRNRRATIGATSGHLKGLTGRKVRRTCHIEWSGRERTTGDKKSCWFFFLLFSVASLPRDSLAARRPLHTGHRESAAHQY